MEKKTYLTPTMKVADLDPATILVGSVTSVEGGDSGIGYGGGNTEPARGKGTVWDDCNEVTADDDLH